MEHVPRLTGVDCPTDPSITPNIFSYYPGFGTQNLDHVPHQCCSSPRMMICILIYYLAVLWLWVLYEACITSKRGELHQRPLYNLQQYPRLAQLLPWLDCPPLEGSSLAETITQHDGWGHIRVSAIKKQQLTNEGDSALPRIDQEKRNWHDNLRKYFQN